jgi:hypothetical protein
MLQDSPNDENASNLQKENPSNNQENASNLQKVTKVNPYKSEEYQKFIETVKSGEIPEHWELLAETLGITSKTIIEWKKLPEFTNAINKGLDEALAKMKETGAKDWRQWRERVSILSREANKQSGTVVNIENVVPIFGKDFKPETVKIESYNIEETKIVPE